MPIYVYTSKKLIHPGVRGVPGNMMNHVLYKNVRLEPATTQR